MISLEYRVRELIHEHGGIRAAARALKLDPGYLSRLRSGVKKFPSPTTLRKLGLCGQMVYFRIAQPCHRRQATATPHEAQSE